MQIDKYFKRICLCIEVIVTDLIDKGQRLWLVQLWACMACNVEDIDRDNGAFLGGIVRTLDVFFSK